MRSSRVPRRHDLDAEAGSRPRAFALASRLAPLLLLLPAAAAAQRVEVTPFVGYRLGGGLEDFEISNDDFDFDDDDSLGVSIDIEVGENAFVEILYSAQETTLQDDGGFLGDRALFPIDVDYWHLGGLYAWEIGEAFQPYLVATLGITEFDPQPAEISGETRFSMGIGGGIKLMLGRNVGFRFEGRGYTTVVDSESETFCDRGRCYKYSTGTYLWQFEGRAGVVLAF